MGKDQIKNAFQRFITSNYDVDNMPHIQMLLLEDAFFAGAVSYYAGIMDSTKGADDNSPKIVNDAIDSMNEEIIEFLKISVSRLESFQRKAEGKLHS